MCFQRAQSDRVWRHLTALAILAIGVLHCIGGVPATAPSDELAAFRAECASRAEAADKAGMMSVPGKDGWRFFDGELRHLAAGVFWGDRAATVSRAGRPDYADPLPAILDFKAQLDQAKIELILLPVPAKAAIHPDRFSQLAGIPEHRVDPADAQFFELLRAKGIRVLDLTDNFLAAAREGKEEPFCKTDTHWSGVGCERAAHAVTGEIKARPWLERIKRQKFDAESRSVDIVGDLAAAERKESTPKESVRLRFVGTRRDGELQPIDPDPASPILLLGDSHVLVFHEGGDLFARGAGLPDQLAFQLGLPVDVVAVRGSGATAARINLALNTRNDADYLKSKRLVLWCFAVREFTQSEGWQKVPLIRPPMDTEGRR